MKPYESPPTVIACEISKMPKDPFDPMPVVTVFFDNDPKTPVKLYDYYPDELSFHPSEFIGLTKQEALNLKRKKDVAYLQS